MTRLLIVDYHELVAETLGNALSGAELDVATINPSHEDPALAFSQRVDFCLLDLDWGHQVFSGVSLIRGLVDAGAVVLILTGTMHEPLFGYCLELGAAGVISKQSSFSELVDVVQRAIAGEPPNSDGDRYRWIMEAHKAREEHRRRLHPFDALTQSEGDVLVELLEGHTAAEIAELRTVAISTVRSHIRQILQKLGVNSQLAAVAMARDAGWPRSLGVVDTESAPDLSSVLPTSRIA